MSDTLWGTKSAGSSVAEGEDGVAFVAEVPDYVQLPASLGGTRHPVAKAYVRDCPCRAGHQSKTFALEGTTIQVSECPLKGFLWWRESRKT